MVRLSADTIKKLMIVWLILVKQGKLSHLYTSMACTNHIRSTWGCGFSAAAQLMGSDGLQPTTRFCTRHSTRTRARETNLRRCSSWGPWWQVRGPMGRVNHPQNHYLQHVVCSMNHAQMVGLPTRNGDFTNPGGDFCGNMDALRSQHGRLLTLHHCSHRLITSSQTCTWYTEVGYVVLHQNGQQQHGEWASAA